MQYRVSLTNCYDNDPRNFQLSIPGKGILSINIVNVLTYHVTLYTRCGLN